MEYWLLVANTPQGPFAEQALTLKIQSRELGPDSLVCPVGATAWAKVQDVPSLAGHVPAMPPLPPATAAGGPHTFSMDGTPLPGQDPVNPKMLIACIVLASCNLAMSLLTAGATESSTTADLLGFCVWAASMTTWLLFHYAIWSYVPPQYRQTTPGKAVGFLFIPFYNFYWVFQSCVGLSRGINRLADAQGYPGMRVNTGLATAFSIFWIANFLFTLGAASTTSATADEVTGLKAATFVVAEAPGFVLWLLMVLNQKRVVEAMAEHAASAAGSRQPVLS